MFKLIDWFCMSMNLFVYKSMNNTYRYFSRSAISNREIHICLWVYILNWVLTNFPYKLLWTIMDTLWTVVITQPQSIDVGKHFTVMIIKLLNAISRIPIIHLLPIYFCTNSSWNVRAAICLEGCLSFLALSSVYSLTVEPWCRHSCLSLYNR